MGVLFFNSSTVAKWGVEGRVLKSLEGENGVKMWKTLRRDGCKNQKDTLTKIYQLFARRLYSSMRNDEW